MLMTLTADLLFQHAQKHLTMQHAINLYECNIFDMLLSDGGDSQRGVNENCNENQIGIK